MLSQETTFVDDGGGGRARRGGGGRTQDLSRERDNWGKFTLDPGSG